MAIPGISKTCIYVAAGRAIGAREPDPAVRNPDILAEQLLGDVSVFEVDHPTVRALGKPYEEAMASVDVVGTVRMMTVRTRRIDEALERAVRDGARQLVILGAGFDTHAYRCRELLQDVRVFEVDRPATQALKQERVLATLGAPPANLTYVPIDFQHDHLAEVLARHGHEVAQRTFFIMEGVTMYVPEDALRRTLQFVGRHPPGSAIVFDFVPRAMIERIASIDIDTVPPAAKAFVQRFFDLTRDEPWVFGIPLGSEAEFLGEFGLEVREVLAIGGPESVARYLTRADGTEVGGPAIAEYTTRATRQAPGDARPADSEARQERARQMRREQRQMAYQLAEAVVRGQHDSPFTNQESRMKASY